MRSPFLPRPTRFPDLPSVAPRTRFLRLLLLGAFALLIAATAGWFSARTGAPDPADAALQQNDLPVG